ncbi:MAG: phospho-N-acetylmuramoyl-pentapeptide-transferase [Clostridia bacterium]|jgi:phospho-N-acetylmuramoyl-pentapeptide-transferase|nr:phospho-N-acetylmuramoyl-pentapeptide-transferase [Clostridia bacterium]
MRNILFCLLASFLVSFLLCVLLIPLLKRLGAGQNILHYVKEHKNKGGTPTMGGLAFILAASVVAFAANGTADKPFLVTLAVGIGYLAVGFLDDFLKKARGNNLGLRPYQKIIFQFAVAVMAGIYCCLEGLTVVKIPYTSVEFDLGWGMLPLAVLVLIATVNSVNLTDGLDGLAGSVSAVFFAVVGGLVLLQEQDSGIPNLCFCLTGALLAFLVFNVNRASVFMGDTGSLSLGGFAACAALFSGNALVIPIVGVMFVLSSISVIIQVIYYKKTGKRIFLMAPIHHHFQEKGHSEGKIAYIYSVITVILGISLLLPFV